MERETKIHAGRGVDIAALITKTGWQGQFVEFQAKEDLFRQGDRVETIFYVVQGHVRLTVLSKAGREATIGIAKAGDFVGEEAIGAATGQRLMSATAMTDCKAYKSSRSEIIKRLNENATFSNFFVKHLLAKSVRTQADLIDQLFNSSEKRLARVLLLMAEYGQPGENELQIPPVTQEALAEMIGTTRGRVSFFMNRFRKLGFIEYNGRIRVYRSLLNVILHDTLPEQLA